MIILLSAFHAAAGSLDVLSVPFLIIALAIYGWFTAALGVWVSLQLRSTWRAQFFTIACLILCNVIGQGVINLTSKYGYGPQVWPGFTPYEICKLVLGPQFLQRLTAASWMPFWLVWTIDDGLPWLTRFSVAMRAWLCDARDIAHLARPAGVMKSSPGRAAAIAPALRLTVPLVVRASRPG